MLPSLYGKVGHRSSGSLISESQRPYLKNLLIATSFGIIGFFVNQFVSSVSSVHQRESEERSPDIGDIVFDIQSGLAKFAETRLKNDMPKVFLPKSMEVELSFVIKRKTTAGGKVEHIPVVVEAGMEYAKEQVQRIKLLFQALEPKKEYSGNSDPMAFRDTPPPAVPAKKGAK
jgi:hypothetical protein